MKVFKSKDSGRLISALPTAFKKYDAVIEDFTHDEDGYWLYPVYGFYNSCPGSHIIHEDTMKEVLAALKDVKPCNCKECEANK